LLYGREPKLPIDVNLSSHASVDEEEFSIEYVKHVVDVMQKIRDAAINEAHKAIDIAQEKQRKQYNSRHQPKDPLKEGDRVLLKNLKRSDRKGGKATLPWLGPYTILEVFHNNTCRLSSQSGELAKKYNLCNLKRYHDISSEEVINANNTAAEQPDQGDLWIPLLHLKDTEKKNYMKQQRSLNR